MSKKRPESLTKLFKDGAAIATQSTTNLFQSLEGRELSAEEQDIVNKRVELQRNLLKVYEARELQRKVKELQETWPELADIEAQTALKLCNGKEDDAMISLTHPSFLKHVRKDICAAAKKAAKAAPPEAAPPRRTRQRTHGPVPLHGGSGDGKNEVSKNSDVVETDITSRGKPVDPNALDSGIFVGKYGKRLGRQQQIHIEGTLRCLESSHGVQNEDRVQLTLPKASVLPSPASPPFKTRHESSENTSHESNGPALRTCAQGGAGPRSRGLRSRADSFGADAWTKLTVTQIMQRIDAFATAPNVVLNTITTLRHLSDGAFQDKADLVHGLYRSTLPEPEYHAACQATTPASTALPSAVKQAAADDQSDAETVSDADTASLTDTTRKRSSRVAKGRAKQPSKTRAKHQKLDAPVLPDPEHKLPTTHNELDAGGKSSNKSAANKSKAEPSRDAPEAVVAVDAKSGTHKTAISARGFTVRGRVKNASSKRATLVKVGTLRTEKGWYNAGYIFPDGFHAQTLFRSSVQLDSTVVHDCFIVGATGAYWPLPTFVLISADRPDEPLTGKSCTACWSQVLKRVNAEIEGRRQAGEDLPPPPKTAIAGPEYFGLNMAEIVDLIEDLDPEHLCTTYWAGKHDRQQAVKAQSKKVSGKAARGVPVTELQQRLHEDGLPWQQMTGVSKRRRNESNDEDSKDEVYTGTNAWSLLERSDRYKKRCEEKTEVSVAVPDDNPMPGHMDPITLEPVVCPAMAPSGHVMGIATWRVIIKETGVCPFTKTPLLVRQLVELTKVNIHLYADKIIGWDKR